MGEALTATSSEEIEVDRFQDDALTHYWPHMAKELENVPHLWKDRYTLEYFFESAIDGSMQVWGVGTRRRYDVIFFTEINVYPSGLRAVHVKLAFGRNIDAVLPMVMGMLQRFAISQCCGMIEGTGRLGWSKMVKSYGMRPVGLAFQMAVYERMQ